MLLNRSGFISKNAYKQRIFRERTAFLTPLNCIELCTCTNQHISGFSSTLSAQGNNIIHHRSIPTAGLLLWGQTQLSTLALWYWCHIMLGWPGTWPILQAHMTHLVLMPQADATPLDKAYVAFLLFLYRPPCWKLNNKCQCFLAKCMFFKACKGNILQHGRFLLYANHQLVAIITQGRYLKRLFGTDWLVRIM